MWSARLFFPVPSVLYIICSFVYISQVTHICLSVHVELSLSLILSVYLPNFISAFLSPYVYLRSLSLSLSLSLCLPLSLTFFLSLRLCYTYLLTQLVTLFLSPSITHTFPPKFILFLNLPFFFAYTHKFLSNVRSWIIFIQITVVCGRDVLNLKDRLLVAEHLRVKSLSMLF